MAEAVAAAPVAVKAAGGSKKTMIIGIVVGAVVAGGGATGAFMFLGKKHPPADKEGAAVAGEKGGAEKAHKPKHVGKHAEPGHMEKLAPFVVNLRDTTANRYLKATLELELGSAKEADKFKKYIPQVRHEILMYLSSLSVAEIQGEGGKQILVKELLAKVQKSYDAGEVSRLFFTEFVVQ